MDMITLSPIEISTLIGILPEEKKTQQTIIVHLELYFNIRKAASTDDISNTVDYARVVLEVEAFAQDNHFNLIETFAERLSERLLNLFPIEQIGVLVEKPEAFNEAPNVSVEILRP